MASVALTLGRVAHNANPPAAGHSSLVQAGEVGGLVSSTPVPWCRGGQAAQAARRRTSQTVAAMSSTDSASSQPPSIHWNGQNRVTGW